MYIVPLIVIYSQLLHLQMSDFQNSTLLHLNVQQLFCKHIQCHTINNMQISHLKTRTQFDRTYEKKDNRLQGKNKMKTKFEKKLIKLEKQFKLQVKQKC